MSAACFLTRRQPTGYSAPHGLDYAAVARAQGPRAQRGTTWLALAVAVGAAGCEVPGGPSVEGAVVCRPHQILGVGTSTLPAPAARRAAADNQARAEVQRVFRRCFADLMSEPFEGAAAGTTDAPGAPWRARRALHAPMTRGIRIVDRYDQAQRSWSRASLDLDAYFEAIAADDRVPRALVDRIQARLCPCPP